MCVLLKVSDLFSFVSHLEQMEILADSSVRPRLPVPREYVQMRHVGEGIPRSEQRQEVGGEILGHGGDCLDATASSSLLAGLVVTSSCSDLAGRLRLYT